MIKLTKSNRLYSSFCSSLAEQSSFLNLLSTKSTNKSYTTTRTASGETENAENSNDNTALQRINELFMRDGENLIDEKRKDKFLTANKAQITIVDNEFLNRVYGKHSLMSQISKYVNIITVNQDVKREFLKLAKNRINSTHLSYNLECGWYFCLSNDKRYKGEYLKQLVPALKDQIPQDFNKKFSLRYKVMFSQIIYNYALLFSQNMNLDKGAKIGEGSEHIALEDFTLDFYLKMSSLLEANGIEVATVSNFAEIYYTGIELKDKVIVDIHNVNARHDNKIYKAIRLNNLKEMGYKVIPIMINPEEDSDSTILTRTMHKLRS